MKKTLQLSPDQNDFFSFDDLPDRWALKKLGEIVSPSKEKIEPTAGSTLPYIGLEHIESNSSKIIGHGISGDAKSTKTVFHSGDVLYGKLRPYLNKVTIPDFDGVCSTDILVFNQNQNIDSRYLMRYLSTGDVVEYANRKSKGISLPRVSFDSLAEIPVPLPPLTEQQRIAACVEALLTHVNAARDRLSRVPLIMKRFRQGVLAAACSGRLTDGWRESNPLEETGLDLLQKIVEAKQKKVSKDFQKYGNGNQTEIEQPTEIPKEWTWVTLDQITKNFDGHRIPIKSDDRKKRRGAYPYYGASGIIDTIDDFLFDGEFLLIGEDGANLVMRSTPIAFQVKGKFWVNNHAHILQTNGGIPLQFIQHYINSIDLQQYVTGSAQPKLTQANMNIIPVPLPPLAEQHEIVRRVGMLFERADAIDREVVAAGRRCERLTQAVLGKAFAGKL